MTNFNTKHLIPGATYRVTMTDPDFGSAETKTMTGADLKELAYAVGHLYDMTAEIIETTDPTETEQDTQGAEQTTETAPAAETETAERAAEIADALDDIRHARLAYSYTAKRRVTARCIREAERAGYPTVRVGYCDLQNALAGITPDYYTAGQYGWNCDVYNIAGLNICTGYRPAAGVPAVGVRELQGACRGADTATRDRLFAAWIVTNREIAREGVRA